jgi:hypothetical protein
VSACSLGAVISPARRANTPSTRTQSRSARGLGGGLSTPRILSERCVKTLYKKKVLAGRSRQGTRAWAGVPRDALAGWRWEAPCFLLYAGRLRAVFCGFCAYGRIRITTQPLWTSFFLRGSVLAVSELKITHTTDFAICRTLETVRLQQNHQRQHWHELHAARTARMKSKLRTDA